MKNKNKFLKDKKILIVGLGLLGGGIATCLWLLKHKAKITITDLRNKKDLEKSLKKLKRHLSQIKLVLGHHNKNDFKNHDIIVVNPGVKIKNNQYLKTAKKEKKLIENEMSLFFKFNHSPLITVTGTRGKTTITNWTSHLLKEKYPNIIIGGNIPENPVLSFLDKTKANIPAVLEISSFQLELLKGKYQAPKIAIITNLFRDHLNRHTNMKDYAKVKSNIFKNQKDNDYLILNYQNKWTNFFLSLKPKSQIYFISNQPLPLKKNGIFNKADQIYFQNDRKKQLIFNLRNFSHQWGEHNLNNLMFSILAAKLFGLSFSQIKQRIPSLPHIHFREEVIYQSPSKQLIIINDSSATTPEATMAALKRFSYQKNNNLILITGGTDKNLEYNEMAKKIKKYILPKNLIILNGSASKKLINELIKIKYSNYYSVFESLSECFYYSLHLRKKGGNIILFSPGATSFEKFKNEFDRGKKFNDLIENIKLLK
jgi:UDP-N-acetylmuramoylalanine--D-glutamate ligase